VGGLDWALCQTLSHGCIWDCAAFCSCCFRHWVCRRETALDVSIADVRIGDVVRDTAMASAGGLDTAR
jgi:hypothetical protein